MDSNQALNFESGQSRAEAGQFWNTAQLGGEDVGNAISMTEKFATAGGQAEAYRERAEQAARAAEMVEKGVLAGTEFSDIKNDGVESEVEKGEVIDALAEEGDRGEGLRLDQVKIYENSKKGNVSRGFAERVGEVMNNWADRPADIVDMLRRERGPALLQMFRRRFPYNGEGEV